MISRDVSTASEVLDLGHIIDTHVHIWDPVTTPRSGAQAARYYKRWPTAFEAVFPVVAPPSVRHFIRTPRYVGRPFGLQDYRRAAAECALPQSIPAVRYHVESFVHVEANWAGEGFCSVDETRWLLQQVEGGSPPMAAAIVRADPRDPQVGAILDAHTSVYSHVAGVRCSAASHPHRHVRDWIDTPNAYTSGQFLRGFEAIAARDLVFDAWVYDHQLADVAYLARQFPSTTIVLNHYGTPVGLFGEIGAVSAAGRDRIARWRDALCELAELPNVYAKHSGIGMPILGFRTPVSPRDFIAMVLPYITDVTRIFGPDRLMFGSNTPMDSIVAAVPTIVTAVALGVREVAGHSALTPVFRENAQRIYKLERTPSHACQ